MKKLLGFTLAEVLMALAIIGIITALAVTTMKPAEKSALKYQYMNAYMALSRAFYNGLLQGYDPFTEEDSPVHSEAEDTGAEILCQGLTTFINTRDNERTADHDYASTCSSTKITPQVAKPEDFMEEVDDELVHREDRVQFTASNGMIFYISNMLEGTVGTGTEAEDIKFYLVFVDVNGLNKPNSLVYTYKGGKTIEDYDMTNPDDIKQEAKDRIEPDIFAFAMLDNSRVMPLGIAEYDTNVLTARFIYYSEDGDPLYTKRSLPYYQAKGAAWGYYNTTGTDPNPLDFNPDEPFSMNDAVRSLIDPTSDILKDFPDFTTDLEPLAIESSAPFNCSNEDLESCYVFLDEYR